MHQATLDETLGSDSQSLSPQLRRAAQYVLDNPDEVATRSLRQVAREAELPAPTFSRLARAVGLGSYDDLRELARAERARPRFAARALAMVDTDSDAEAPFAVRHAAAMLENNAAMLDRLDHGRLEEAAARLAHARRVVLIGSMSAAPLADYAAYLARLTLADWQIAGRRGSSLASDLVGLEAGDAALVITFAPYARRSVEATAIAADRGAYVALVTDTPLCPAAEAADAVFSVPTGGPQFFPSHAVAMGLIEAMMAMAVRASGAPALARIEAVEQEHHRLGEYWQDSPAGHTTGG